MTPTNSESCHKVDTLQVMELHFFYIYIFLIKLTFAELNNLIDLITYDHLFLTFPFT